MSPRVKMILRIAGYTAFALFCTLFFVYMTFPVDAVQGRINKEIEKQFPQLHISFEHASTHRLSGLDMEELTVTLDGQGDKPSTTLRLDRVRVRAQILPLLRKQYNLVFDVTLGDGTLSGIVKSGADALGVEFDASEVDLAHPPLAGKLIGTTMTGVLNGHVDINIDFNDPKKSAGDGSLELKKSSLGELVLHNVSPMMPGDFTLPPIELGVVAIGVEIKDGTLLLKNVSQKSSDLEIKVTGDVGLRKQVTQAPLNVTLQFKLAEAFTQKNPKLSILTMAGKKGADGFSSVKLGGFLGAPQPQM